MLERIPNAAEMTAEEILAWLTAPRRERLPTVDAMWSIAGIAERFGATVAETIYQALMGSGLSGLGVRFASVGLDAGDPQWEQQVDALAANVPSLAGVADEIRDLGYDTRKQWQLLGLKFEPTLEEIQALHAEYLTLISRQAAKQGVVDRAQKVRSVASLVFDQGGTVDEILAAAQDMWDGTWTEPELPEGEV